MGNDSYAYSFITDFYICWIIGYLGYTCGINRIYRIFINQVSIFGLTNYVLALHEAEAGIGMGNLFLYIGMVAGTEMFGRFLTLDMEKWGPLNNSTYTPYSNAFLVLGLLRLITIIVAFITKKVFKEQKV